MRLRFALVCLVALGGCLRSTREVQREQPVDTGEPIVFGSAKGEKLKWTFGDGSPPVEAAQLQHTFHRSGSQLVEARDGDFVVERQRLIIRPRPVTRAVPADAQSLLWVPSLKEDLAPTVDFFERVAGPARVQQWLEELWLPALAVELGSGGDAIVDPLEGLGVLRMPGFEGAIALVGITEPGAGFKALAQRLKDRGHEEEPTAMPGVSIFLSATQTLAVFEDRGYLYAVVPELPAGGAELLLVVNQLRGSHGPGLEDVAGFKTLREKVQGRRVQFWAQDGTPGPHKPLFDRTWLSLDFERDMATLTGHVRATRPIPSVKHRPALLENAPQDPVAALQLVMPPAELHRLLKQRRADGRSVFFGPFEARGVDTDRGIESLTGELAAAAWFDAEGFLKNLAEGGATEPRGVLQLVAAISERQALANVLSAMLGKTPNIAPYATDDDAMLWHRMVGGSRVTFALTSKALLVRGGDGSGLRANQKLADGWAKKFNGAFGVGHSSLLLDVGQLKRELDEPRQIPGVDATRVVTVQGFASAFLDQVPIDVLVLDAVVDGQGLQLWGRMTLRQRLAR